MVRCVRFGIVEFFDVRGIKNVYKLQGAVLTYV